MYLPGGTGNYEKTVRIDGFPAVIHMQEFQNMKPLYCNVQYLISFKFCLQDDFLVL